MWLAPVRVLCIMHCTLLVLPFRCWRPERPRGGMSLPRGRSILIATSRARKNHCKTRFSAAIVEAALTRREALSLGLKTLHVKSAVA